MLNVMFNAGGPGLRGLFSRFQVLSATANVTELNEMDS